MEESKMKNITKQNIPENKRRIIHKFTMTGALTAALSFSSNSYAGADRFACSDINTLEHYNTILEVQGSNLTPTVRYSLGFTAICIGRYEDGLKHMRAASEGGHIAATASLAAYYRENQSFDDVREANMKNTQEAIRYYEKATRQIEAIPSYPNGTTEDMEYIEYATMTSYRVFTILPALYFNTHLKIMKDIIKNDTSYSNTLDVLQKMGDAATRCLRRPALSVWEEKRERVYRTQQIECQAYLDFVRAIYPLEVERIQIAENCTVRVNQCEQHKEKTKQMVQVIKTLFRALKESPGLVVGKGR